MLYHMHIAAKLWYFLHGSLGLYLYVVRSSEFLQHFLCGKGTRNTHWCLREINVIWFDKEWKIKLRTGTVHNTAYILKPTLEICEVKWNFGARTSFVSSTSHDIKSVYQFNNSTAVSGGQFSAENMLWSKIESMSNINALFSPYK